MNAVCKTTFAGVILLLAAENKSIAQYSSSRYEVGINAGTLIYQGDLSVSRYGDINSLKPALCLTVSRSLDAYFDLRGNLTIGKISADDARYSSPAYKQYRNFKFSTPVAELLALLVWNVAGDNAGRRLNYYFMGGAGVGYLNIKRNWSGVEVNYFGDKSTAITGLGIDTVRSTPRLLPVLPAGAGLRYQLSPAWSVNTEFIYRFTPTDYLDGFSQSVNAKTKDRYYGLSIGIRYRFGSDKYRCPKMN